MLLVRFPFIPPDEINTKIAGDDLLTKALHFLLLPLPQSPPADISRGCSGRSNHTSVFPRSLRSLALPPDPSTSAVMHQNGHRLTQAGASPLAWSPRSGSIIYNGDWEWIHGPAALAQEASWKIQVTSCARCDCLLSPC